MLLKVSVWGLWAQPLEPCPTRIITGIASFSSGSHITLCQKVRVMLSGNIWPEIWDSWTSLELFIENNGADKQSTTSSWPVCGICCSLTNHTMKQVGFNDMNTVMRSKIQKMTMTWWAMFCILFSTVQVLNSWQVTPLPVPFADKENVRGKFPC